MTDLEHLHVIMRSSLIKSNGSKSYSSHNMLAPLGHYVLFLSLRSEKNQKSNERRREKTINLFVEKLMRATK